MVNRVNSDSIMKALSMFAELLAKNAGLNIKFEMVVRIAEPVTNFKRLEIVGKPFSHKSFA